MKLPWTPKPRTASLAELREQVTNAESSLTAAQTATHSAQVAFDDSGDASAEKALIASRTAEQSAIEHVGRAKRLLTAAEADAAAQKRKQLEHRQAELQHELASDPEGTSLDKQQAAAFAAVVEKKIARRKHNEARSTLQLELDNVRRELGQTVNTTFHTFDSTPYHHLVAEQLAVLAAKSDDPLERQYLNALATINF